MCRYPVPSSVRFVSVPGAGVTFYMKLLCIHMHQINYTINVLTCNDWSSLLLSLSISLSLYLSHSRSVSLCKSISRDHCCICMLLSWYLCRQENDSIAFRDTSPQSQSLSPNPSGQLSSFELVWVWTWKNVCWNCVKHAIWIIILFALQPQQTTAVSCKLKSAKSMQLRLVSLARSLTC